MTRPDILDAAKTCVTGKREQDYGSPENNFNAIAALWNAYLGGDYVDTVDVAMMMALLKIARIKSGTGTADSFVDLAGYAACGGEIATRKDEEKIPLDNFVKVNTCSRCGAEIPSNRVMCDACKEVLNRLAKES